MVEPPPTAKTASAFTKLTQALPQYEIAAISTTRVESAEAAAQEYRIPRGYGNHAALVADPSVDLVVVTVKVPHHLELVTAAIDAGKHVFCEWPRGKVSPKPSGWLACERQEGAYRNRFAGARCTGGELRSGPRGRGLRW